MSDMTSISELNETQVRAAMMKRARLVSDMLRTLDAVVHDAQLLRTQLEAEQREWEQSVELSLRAAEDRLRQSAAKASSER